MEAIRIIKNFVELLAHQRSVLPPEALANLPQLAQDLAGLPDNDPYPTADVVVSWCEQYAPVKATLRELLQRPKYEVGDEDIPPTDPKYEATIRTNITLLKETIQTVQQPPSPPTHSNTNQPT
ncbi:MAG: hypothetical protein Fur006_48020 [Coleofasciculaceae cyanobacterium]